MLAEAEGWRGWRRVEIESPQLLALNNGNKLRVRGGSISFAKLNRMIHSSAPMFGLSITKPEVKPLTPPGKH
jgi:hypothetical protein